MPRLLDPMEVGVILEWLAADGSTVRAGGEIVEIETDETDVAFETEETGVLRHRVPPETVVPAGSPIGYVEPADPPAPLSIEPDGPVRAEAGEPSAATVEAGSVVPTVYTPHLTPSESAVRFLFGK